MTLPDLNPLKELLLDEGASLMPYGVEASEPGTIQRVAAGGVGRSGAEGAANPPVEATALLAAAFGPIELEYAALRTDCVLIDRPDRAVVEVGGSDAIEFLGRMLTQDVAALKPGECCNSFWLNRKGRVDADLRVMRGGAARDQAGLSSPHCLLELERGSVSQLVSTLGAFVITEDVTLTPRHDLHRMSVHGPRARDLLRAVDETARDGAPSSSEPNHVWNLALPGGIGCLVDRNDTAGVPGFELMVNRDEAVNAMRALLDRGRPDFLAPGAATDDPGARGQALAAARGVGARRVEAAAAGADSRSPRPSPESIRARLCGWFAFNIARIEAGTPLYRIDFGPQSLPAETGVIENRVNFKKGCYLGQEIVARMHARGHPKQRLVGLRFDDDLALSADGLPPMPVQGDRVLASDALEPGAASDPGVLTEPKPVGSITSSTFSPMLGRVPVALAMVAWSHVAPGTRLLVETDGQRIGATVQDGLGFVPGA